VTSDHSEEPAKNPESAELSHEDLAGRARTAAFWIAGTTLIWQVVSWGLTLVTARILVPEDYGITSMAGMVSPFLGILATLNVGTWIIQTKTFGDDERAAMVTLTTVLGVAATLLSWTVAPLLGVFFKNPEVVAPFRALATVFVLRGTAVVPLSSLRRELHFKPLSLAESTIGISRGFLQLGLAYAGYAYWSLVIGMVYYEAALALWAHAYVGLPRRWSWNPRLYRSFVGFGGAATGSLLLWMGYTMSDQAIIGRLLGKEFLGFYAMAVMLTDLPLAKINAIVRPVFLPYFSKIRDSPDLMHQHFSKFVLAMCSLTMPVLVGLAVVCPNAIPVVLGEKWAPMVLPMQVLCVATFVRSMVDHVPPLLLALGRPQLELRYNLAFFLVMPACFYFMAKAYGPTGIYLTWLVPYTAVSTFAIVILRGETGITARAYTTNLLPPLFGCGVMGGLAWGAGELAAPRVDRAIALGLQIAVGGLGYVGTYWLLFRSQATGIFNALRGA
jgi:O-antigen/teichoic acid export membrane protein